MTIIGFKVCRDANCTKKGPHGHFIEVTDGAKVTRKRAVTSRKEALLLLKDLAEKKNTSRKRAKKVKKIIINTDLIHSID